MGQVTGRKVVIGLNEETVYGVAPVAPTGELAYVKSCGIAGKIDRQTDETLSGFRGMPQSVTNQKDVSGPVSLTAAPQSIGKWCKHLMGGYVVYRPIGTTTITGVTPVRVASTATTGNGTLTFVTAGQTLAWTPPSGTIGTAQAVGAGGRFVLPAGGGGAACTVDIVAGSLPGGNTSDAAVAVYATTEYEHVFTAGALPIGLTIEENYGSDILIANRFARYLGCKIASGKFDINPAGLIDCGFDVRGANFNNDSGVALDATLDDFGHSGFTSGLAIITEGGSAIADITKVGISVDNDLDDTSFTIGAGGVRGALDEGFCKVTGNVEALFKSAALLNKAIAGTESSLRISVANGNGRGSVGNEFLGFYVPRFFYQASTPPVTGPKGLRTSFDFMAHRASTGGELAFEIILRNTRATI